MPHRRASWAAGSVSAANGCVLLYGALIALSLATGWAVEAVEGSATSLVSLLYGIAVFALLGAVGLLGLASHRLTLGALAEGQGTHLALMFGAGGSFLVMAVIAAFGILRDRLAGGDWALPCACVSFWPLLVSVWNVTVLVRHGSALRRDDVLADGDV